MSSAFYMDVHVPQAITDQLRRYGVDVVTAIEDGRSEAPDEQVLARAHELGRIIFTQDIAFKALAEEWQRKGRPFSGLIFGHQLGGTIGQYVRDLKIIGLASEQSEWIGVVAFLPF